MGEFKKGFFEYITAADAEKAHSQTIGWIFDPKSKALSSTQKTRILHLLFGEDKLAMEDFEVVNVFLDYKGINLLIECKNALIVIGNKIKTSLHTYQLVEYEDIILQESKFHSKQKRFIYLTLIGELSDKNNWQTCSYSEIYKTINETISGNNDLNELDLEELCILKSYLNTINQLTSALSWMETDYEVREWVFQNGNFAKSDFYNYDFTNKSEKIKYIAETGLVGFMQTYYYKKVADILTDSKNALFVDVGIKYENSKKNGAGLVQLFFKDLDFKVEYDVYRIGYQIQGDTEKYTISTVTYELGGELELHKLDQIFQLIRKLERALNKFVFSRINPEKSKAYASVSRKLDSKLNYCSPEELADYIKLITEERYPHLIEFKKTTNN